MSKKRHRNHKPKIKPDIIIQPGGTVKYTVKGRIHRTDGPAIEYTDGTKEWYLDNRLHRENAPAIEWSNGTRSWYISGKLHREDGPAVEYSNGDKEWYIKNIRYNTENEYKLALIIYVKSLVFLKFDEKLKRVLKKNKYIMINNLDKKLIY